MQRNCACAKVVVIYLFKAVHTHMFLYLSGYQARHFLLSLQMHKQTVNAQTQSNLVCEFVFPAILTLAMNHGLDLSAAEESTLDRIRCIVTHSLAVNAAQWTHFMRTRAQLNAALNWITNKKSPTTSLLFYVLLPNATLQASAFLPVKRNFSKSTYFIKTTLSPLSGANFADVGSLTTISFFGCSILIAHAIMFFDNNNNTGRYTRWSASQSDRIHRNRIAIDLRTVVVQPADTP